MAECTEPDCQTAAKARGLCPKHLRQARYAGLLPTPPCTVSGCDTNSYAKGLCGFHYFRQHRPLEGRDCRDCGTPLSHRPGKGSWPERCPACAKKHANALQRAGYAKRPKAPATCGEKGCTEPAESGKRRCGSHALCTVAGCGRPRQDGKRCAVHRREYRLQKMVAAGRLCSVEGCSNPEEARRFCRMHLRRVDTTGDPGPAERLVAPAGSRLITNTGYVQVTVNGRKTLEHRSVVEQALGRPLQGYENVHHKNGRRTDNRLENLEVWVTPQPVGQRPEDLVLWVVEHYPQLVRAALRGQQLSMF